MKRSREFDEDDSSHDEPETLAVPVTKIINLDKNEQLGDVSNSIIQCSLPGHASGLAFTGYGEYEKHYNNAHMNRCLDCGKNFPSAHFLDLHIRENHDALTAIKKEKGEMIYACFVETCTEKFKGHGKRENHLVKAHAFPQNYFFAVTKFGIDRRQSMLVEHHKGKGSRRKEPHQPTRSSAVETSESATDHQERSGSDELKDVQMYESSDVAIERPDKSRHMQKMTSVEPDMDALTTSMSSLKFVPRTVRLGQKKKA